MHSESDPSVLKKRIEKLERKLRSRITIERAKGYLMEWTKRPEESVYIAMRRLSMDTRKPIREIAEGIIIAQRCMEIINEGG